MRLIIQSSSETNVQTEGRIEPLVSPDVGCIVIMTQTLVLEYLKRDPMRHVMQLKMLHHHADKATVQHVQADLDEGVLITLPATAFSYDLHTYPEVDWIAFLVSDSAEIATQLLNHLPNGNIVFKLIADHDAAAIRTRFEIKRKRAFLSYTTDEPSMFSADRRVQISQTYDPRLQPLFQMNDYDSAEIKRYLADGAQTFAIFDNDAPLSVGIIFRNFGNVWEIGGLRTRDVAKRRGLSAAITRTAIAAIGQLGGQLRYQLHESNVASRKLAESLGLHLFLTVTHYQGDV